MAVPVEAEGKELKLVSPAKLFSTRIVRETTPGYNYSQQYDVSPDGETFPHQRHDRECGDLTDHHRPQLEASGEALIP